MLKKLIILVVFLSITAPVFGQSIDTAWVRRYDGPYNIDRVNSIAVDKSGNVVVAGYSMRNGTTMDYATIKYYPNGDTAWVRRYCDSTNGTSGANDLAIDDSGNVYVTGFTLGLYYYPQEYATIKYYPNGDTAWVRRYHGKDYANNDGISIAVDDSHNVYVTGASSGNGLYDYGTIKYYPNGDTAWVRVYDGSAGYDVPYDVEVDHSGNIYITGISQGSSTNYDYATVKYYPNGDTAWVRRYNGPGNSIDEASAIAVDGSGNVYVTGHSNYDATNFDYATIKYYPNGDTAWVRRYDGTGRYNFPVMALGLDSKGNIYVTGSLLGNGSNRDYTTIKYYPDGALAWVRRYNGTGNSDDYAKDLTIDNADNLYVTGYSKNLAGTYDITTVKYGQEGSAYCVRKYNTGTSGADIDYNAPISVDNTENVYVAGKAGTNFVTIKYFPIILVGDANSDGSATISDVIYLINYLFKEGPAPDPIRAGDVNGDGEVTISDVVYLINYLFKGGPPPVC